MYESGLTSIQGHILLRAGLDNLRLSQLVLPTGRSIKMLQVTRQFFEVPAMLDQQSSRCIVTRDLETHVQTPETVFTSLEARRTSPNGGLIPKYKIINATTNGPDYIPTEAQILAAEMAEEFYGTQVTFVHADAATFKSIVQKLTGNTAASENSRGEVRIQAAAALRGDNMGFGSSSDTSRTRLVVSAPQGNSKAKARGNAGLPKRGSFKQQARRQNLKTAELQGLQVHDLSQSGHGQMQCYAASSTLLSPISPFTAFQEFENSSSGEGGSTHAREDESQMDGYSQSGFTFPLLSQKSMIYSQPQLLPLFPEAPVYNL